MHERETGRREKRERERRVPSVDGGTLFISLLDRTAYNYPYSNLLHQTFLNIEYCTISVLRTQMRSPGMDLSTALREALVAEISADASRGPSGSDLIEAAIRFNSSKWTFRFLPDATYRVFAIAEARERVCISSITHTFCVLIAHINIHIQFLLLIIISCLVCQNIPSTSIRRREF